MKIFLEFITEEFQGILELEDLAEMISRLQADTESQKIMKGIILKEFQDLLNSGGNYAVKKEFEKQSDLKIKGLMRGKFQLVYDYDRSMQYV